MDFEPKLTRREMVKWGLLSTGVPVLSSTLGTAALAQNLGPGNRFVGDTGGGQLRPANVVGRGSSSP